MKWCVTNSLLYERHGFKAGSRFSAVLGRAVCAVMRCDSVSCKAADLKFKKEKCQLGVVEGHGSFTAAERDHASFTRTDKDKLLFRC